MTTQKRKDRARSPTVELLRATSRGKLHKVIQSINEGAELAVNESGYSALHIACHKGFLDIVRILLNAGFDLDIQDDKGDTALHRSCIAGHDLIVRRLIEEGCSVDRQNELGDTALHEAASRGYSRCVKALIEGRVNIGLKNKNLDTPIHLACANSHSGSLRLLLSSFPHSSPRNAQGDSPLHIAVRFGHVTCARVLISSQCTIDLQNKRGNTPLHIGTVARHRKLVRVLLDSGAQAKTVLNKDRKSALDIAKDNDDGETAVMLLSGLRKSTNDNNRGRKTRRTSDHRRSHSEPRKQDVKKLLDGSCSFSSSGRRPPVLTRPKSATLPRKSYVQARAKWRRHERRKIVDDNQDNIFEKQQREITVNPFVVPQLYSLYRDCHGNVRQQPVIDRLPNPTPEIVTSITTAVTSTKGVLLQEMQKTNTLLEKRLDQLENHTDFKVAKLDQITKERIKAERMQCLHRIDRRAMLERVVVGTSGSLTKPKNYHEYSKTPCHTAELCEKPCNHEKNASVADHIETSDDLMSHQISNTDRSSVTDYHTLQPYKTVRIGGRGDTGATWCNGSSNRGVNCGSKKFVTDSLNYSDSAYGSLSPRPILDNSIPLKSFSTASMSRNRPCPDSSRSQQKSMYHSMHTLPRNREKQTLHTFSDQEPEVVTRVTQQFFDNVTHAMEDWYERRLQEVTVKQQREMDHHVAELEDRMKAMQMQSSMRSQNNSACGPSTEDFV